MEPNVFSIMKWYVYTCMGNVDLYAVTEYWILKVIYYDNTFVKHDALKSYIYELKLYIFVFDVSDQNRGLTVGHLWLI